MYLQNEKHEEFARLLAKGVRQGEAYIKAGYSDNKGAASRLANRPLVSARVKELRAENFAQMQANAEVLEGADLSEMGLTMDWCARQYKVIFDKALEAGNFSAANAAVQNIQKLVRASEAEVDEPVVAREEKISVKDTLALLSGLRELFNEDVHTRQAVMIDRHDQRRMLEIEER